MMTGIDSYSRGKTSCCAGRIFGEWLPRRLSSWRFRSCH